MNYVFSVISEAIEYTPTERVWPMFGPFHSIYWRRISAEDITGGGCVSWRNQVWGSAGSKIMQTRGPVVEQAAGANDVDHTGVSQPSPNVRERLDDINSQSSQWLSGPQSASASAGIIVYAVCIGAPTNAYDGPLLPVARWA